MSKLNQIHQFWFCNPFSWIKLLIQNKGVHSRNIGSAVIITLISVFSYPIQLINALIILWKSRNLKKQKDPVFIIGHWRGGTTFLHYILAKDKRFGFLTYYHAFVPNLIFVGGILLKKYLATLAPRKRPQDNINIALDLPTEEENPLSTFSSYSASHSFFFPQNESYYRKFAIFEGTSEKEKRNWQKAYKWMLKRISAHQNGKQLLIKNPHNTGRVKELLELYPNAKFIHIYRNPYEIYPSTYLMYDHVIKTQFLQNYSKEDIEQKIIYYYSSMMNRYFNERHLIPKGQLSEIKFEDFENDPKSAIKSIYKELELDLGDEAFSKMEELIDQEKDYVKNTHNVPVHIMQKINKEWAFSFNQLNYQLLD